MQAVILSPGTCEDALRSNAARKQISPRDARRVIVPSRSLTSEERLDIYRDMYEGRLLEALASDYPGLLDYLGREPFSELMRRYLRRYPSHSYTLNRLGDHVPEFIRKHANVRRAGFVEDLARLELTQTLVFDEQETPALTHEQIAAVPAGRWDAGRLVPVAALRLLSLRYPVHSYLEAMHDAKRLPAIGRKDTWLAVFRRDYVVHWLPLKRTEYRLLEALMQGRKLGRAVSAVRAKDESLRTWFERWTSARFFQAVKW
jgi:hypothetical protein